MLPFLKIVLTSIDEDESRLEKVDFGTVYRTETVDFNDLFDDDSFQRQVSVYAKRGH